MATCPSCGYHEIGLTTNPGHICRRPICPNRGSVTRTRTLWIS